MAQTESEEFDHKLTQIKAVIDRRAQLKGVTFKQELRNYLELVGSEIKPEFKRRLELELEK